MGVSLKLVIGSLAAVIIILTTVLALVITQSFTMKAMRNIGRDHAVAIVAAANSQVSGFFDQAVLQSRNMQILVGLDTWMIPTDSAAAGSVWYAPLVSQMFVMHRLFNFSYFTNVMSWFADGSWLMLYPPGVNATTTYMFVSLGRAKAMGFLSIRLSDGKVVSAYLPTTGSGTDVLVSENWIKYSYLGRMQQAWAEVGFGFGSGAALDIGYSTLNSALVNASGTRIGQLGVNFALGQLRNLLMTVKLTVNSNAFMLDNRNMIIATTQNFNITKWRGTYNASETYGPDCYNTSAVGVGVVCRFSAAHYPFAPLRDLAGRSAQLLNASAEVVTDGAELMQLDGKTYYVSVARIVCQTPLPMKIALLMPESDIIGEVIKGRNIAIGVMSAVCVVFVLIAFLFITVVLAPLGLIADQMYDAAELDDNSTDESLSALTEIAALQDSYHNLRHKLNEMKAFVPQTVLHGEDDEEGSIESDKDKPSDSTSHQSRRSRHSREAGGSVSDTASARGGLTSKGLNVAASLSKKGVSVLSVNVRQFQKTLDPLSVNDGLALCSKMAAAVVKEVRNQKGVIGLFHGDHFLATFNASSPAASPAKRASIAALKIAEALKGLNMKGSFGVAFGTATCGNTGCSDLKGYSVIGPVVAQAVAMERLAKVYSIRTNDEINTLATDKCAVDMECEVFFQIVDYVCMPQPMLVVAVMGLKSSKEDEWMYRLQETASKDPFMNVNTGFRALADGDVKAATAALERRVASSTADAFGAAQLQKKIFDSGKAFVEDTEELMKCETNPAAMPITSYGTYFRALF